MFAVADSIIPKRSYLLRFDVRSSSWTRQDLPIGPRRSGPFRTEIDVVWAGTRVAGEPATLCLAVKSFTVTEIVD